MVWRLVYSHTGCPGPCDWQLQQQQIGTDTWSSVALPAPTDPANVGAQILSNAQGQIVIPFYGHIAGGATTSQARFDLTSDRGKHWTQRVDPCGTSKQGENDAYQSSEAPDGTLAVLCVSKSGGPDSPFVVTSTDGGRTFGPMRTLPSNPLDSFYNLVASGQSAIAVATGGSIGNGAIVYTLAVSNDDGATWTTVVNDPETLGSESPTPGFLAFTTPSVAHWIGDPGKLWTTTDGGGHWTTSTP